METRLNSRIQHKHDTEINWSKATSFIPIAGEIIIYDVDDNNSQPRIKIGNGSSTVGNLPFLSVSGDSLQHSALELYDTIKGQGFIAVNAALPGKDLSISLTSNQYTDFSDISLLMSYDTNSQTIQSDSSGTIVGLQSVPTFTLSVFSDLDGFNATDITITCSYRLDLSKVIHDYILHVSEEEGEGDTSDDVISIVTDTTLSVAGAAADALATGTAIEAVNTRISNLTADDIAYKDGKLSDYLPIYVTQTEYDTLDAEGKISTTAPYFIYETEE